MVSRTRGGHVLVWEQPGLEDQRQYSGEFINVYFPKSHLPVPTYRSEDQSYHWLGIVTKRLYPRTWGPIPKAYIFGAGYASSFAKREEYKTDGEMQDLPT